MDKRIRLLIVTDKKGMQHKLKNIFENEGFNVAVVDAIDIAQRFIYQECKVVLCQAYTNGAVPVTLIKECKQQEIPIATMGSNPAHFVEWRKLGVLHAFDSDELMGSTDVAQKAVKACATTLQKLVSKCI